MNINQKIKKYIDDKGLIQKTVAKNMGLTPVAFNMIVNNKQALQAEDLIKFCEQVGEDVDFIIHYGEKGA